MQNFDIITLADAPRSAFYLHGQFTAFRSQALYDNLLLADGYASPSDFVTRVHPDRFADEHAWSDLLLKDPKMKDRINWFALKGLCSDFNYEGKKFIHFGNRIFEMPESVTQAQIEAQLDVPGAWPSSSSLFTPEGRFEQLNTTDTSPETCSWWDPIKYCPVISDADVDSNRVYYMQIDGQLQVRIEPASQPVFDAWNAEFKALYWSLGKSWIRFPSVEAIGSYEDTVWVFGPEHVEAWRKGKPEELIFTQDK